MADTLFIEQLLTNKRHASVVLMARYEINRALAATSAFLNHNGGWILIGHNGDKSIGIKGNIKSRIRDLEVAIANRIHPQPLIYVTAVQYQDQNLILVNVLKGNRTPYTADGQNYSWTGEKVIKSSTDDISRLLRNTYDDQPLWEDQYHPRAQYEDISLKEVDASIEAIKAEGKANYVPSQIRDFLGYYQMADYNRLRNSAVLLFGKSPKRLLQQCRVRINILPEGKASNQFEVLIIEENLFQTFSQLEAYFESNIPVVNDFSATRWDRARRKKYPKDALREAILNALVHRNYANFSSEVTINIFKDTIEIINPGEILPDILKSGEDRITYSVLRNPTITHMFYLRGKMEVMGRGIPMIRQRFKELDLKEPKWESRKGQTKLTLYSVTSVKTVNDRILKFLAIIKIEDIFDRQDYESLLSKPISEKTARNDLSVMLDQGLIERIGAGKATKYIRTSKLLPGFTG